MFGSNPGDNVTFGLIIAVGGTFAAAQFDTTTKQYGRTIVWSLRRALSAVSAGREQLNSGDDDLIRAGTRSQRRHGLSRVLKAIG